MDLAIENARLATQPDGAPCNIGVRDGRIAAIEPFLLAAADTYDAGGRLVCGGLIETHIHLDKSRIVDRVPPPDGRRVNPVTMTAPLKKDFTTEDVYRRAEATLRECLVNGTTRMRTQPEIDPAVELRSFERCARWHRITVGDRSRNLRLSAGRDDQLSGTEELLVAALKQGAPVSARRRAMTATRDADRARLRIGRRVRCRSRPASRCRRHRARLGLFATNGWHLRLVGYWWSWVVVSAIITAATTSLTTSPHVVP